KLVWHGVLLVFGAPCQLPLLAGAMHGLTTPLGYTGPVEVSHRSAAKQRVAWFRKSPAPAYDLKRADPVPVGGPAGLLCITQPLIGHSDWRAGSHAVCRSPKNICKHIDDCLHQTSNNKDAVQIREGVRTRNGKIVWAGAEACARDLNIKRQWDSWVRECSDLEYVSIAKVVIELGKVFCDRYSQ